MDYLDNFATWYPQFLQQHAYPIYAAKTFTEKERDAAFLALTKKQQTLLLKHKKFRLRSLFLKNNYLQASSWRFVSAEINPHYPEPLPNGEQLRCDCGHLLKYQYILKEVRGPRVIRLGIKHFADHLNVPLEVAREIQKGINQVNVALDELLFLNFKQIAFPEYLWKKYTFAFFQNNQLANPVLLNMKLAQRVLEFRQAQMPIYLADFQELEKEIQRVNQRARLQTKKVHLRKAVYEQFEHALMQDLLAEQWLNPKICLTPDIALLRHDPQQTQALSKDFFQALYQELKGIKRNSQKASAVAYTRFVTSKWGRELPEALIDYLFETHHQYGVADNFLLQIPLLLRNGLMKEIKREKRTAQRQQFEALLAQQPASYYQELAHLLEKTAELQTLEQKLTTFTAYPQFFTVEAFMDAFEQLKLTGVAGKVLKPWVAYLEPHLTFSIPTTVEKEQTAAQAVAQKIYRELSQENPALQELVIQELVSLLERKEAARTDD
ncbi:MAG: hypothetical protein ACK5MW_02005 [Enterococcus sp.]